MSVDYMQRYLSLERIASKAVEPEDEVFADALRDLMDNVWLQLTDQEHESLDHRIVTGVDLGVSDKQFALNELQASHPRYAPIVRYVKLLEHQLGKLHICDEPYCDCPGPTLFQLEAWKDANEDTSPSDKIVTPSV